MKMRIWRNHSRSNYSLISLAFWGQTLTSTSIVDCDPVTVLMGTTRILSCALQNSCPFKRQQHFKSKKNCYSNKINLPKMFLIFPLFYRYNPKSCVCACVHMMQYTQISRLDLRPFSGCKYFFCDWEYFNIISWCM